MEISHGTKYEDFKSTKIHFLKCRVLWGSIWEIDRGHQGGSGKNARFLSRPFFRHEKFVQKLIKFRFFGDNSRVGCISPAKLSPKFLFYSTHISLCAWYPPKPLVHGEPASHSKFSTFFDSKFRHVNIMFWGDPASHFVPPTNTFHLPSSVSHHDFSFSTYNQKPPDFSYFLLPELRNCLILRPFPRPFGDVPPYLEGLWR